ncbi:chitinase [Plectosphaerella cucumerina]|jgi:hypothetical protein|uniref:chitinase n=1 Tax=Plectosphaerella cucumerina TaxID=40658 RepID=A0A8K0TNK2_9PEZI|nr:chitinase [Plectosphaerella cucumerina]
MAPLPRGQNAALPRIITYYQTHHTPEGKFIPILPVITESGISVTHVILAALHINEDPDKITLNDHHPSHPRFQPLWAELSALQASGVKVMGMLGGAAPGSFIRLDADAASFERYWTPIRDLIRERNLDGIDLDVEETMSIDGIVRLIDRIKADFGSEFIISLAPVAAAMINPTKNLSGFDYMELELRKSEDIAFYNTQFYNGWGNGANAIMYEMMLRQGWPRQKIVIGLLTSPENGHGWVPWDSLGAVLLGVRSRYNDFGGVMGWEYFNSLPGGRARPWEWARWMTTMLRPEYAGSSGGAPTANVSDTAEKVQRGLVAEADPDHGATKDAPVPEKFEYYTDGSDTEEP